MLHACEAATEGVRHVAVPGPVGSFALRGRGGLVCAMAGGFAVLDPDAWAMDVEGRYWSAEWGGVRLVRFGPDGAARAVASLSVSIPTSCAFGGPDLCTLFVTTSRWDLGLEALAREPWAGGLLAMPAPGLPVPRFAG